jgi:hypothetical protein
MPELALVIRDKLNGKEFDVEVPDDKRVGELARALREELGLQERDARGLVTYKLVLLRTGVLLDSTQTLRDAGVKDQDTLSFWGEPQAAAADQLRQQLRMVFDRFGDHPNLTIEPRGNPPKEYLITYRLRGPVRLSGTSFVFGDSHVAFIQVTENFPRERASVTMKTPACHPNISSAGNVCIGTHQYSAESVADIIAKVGNYLQYREYDLGNPYPNGATDLARQADREGRRIGPFDTVGFGA